MGKISDKFPNTIPLHPILFPLFALVSSQMKFKFLVPGGLAKVFTLRGFGGWLRWWQTTDQWNWQSVLKRANNTNAHYAHPQAFTLTLILIFKLWSVWIWHNILLCVDNWQLFVWSLKQSSLSLVNVQLNPRGMQKTWKRNRK